MGNVDNAGGKGDKECQVESDKVERAEVGWGKMPQIFTVITVIQTMEVLGPPACQQNCPESTSIEWTCDVSRLFLVSAERDAVRVGARPVREHVRAAPRAAQTGAASVGGPGGEGWTQGAAGPGVGRGLVGRDWGGAG